MRSPAEEQLPEADCSTSDEGVSVAAALPGRRAREEDAAGAFAVVPFLLFTAGSSELAASPGFHVFHLHSTVLCSNSAYFRARVTSAVGMSCLGSKRSRGETMEEVMEADEREAAASVLYFFYTSKLRAQDSASCSASFLLQMMKTAVFELLRSDALCTDAEATVLLLLSEWIVSENGMACCEEDLQQLNGIKLLTKDVAQEMKVQTRTATPVNHSGTGFRFTDGDGTTLGALDVEWWTPYIVKRCVRIVATVTNICA
ncbi:MAG: hypothetical protein WDW38_000160 [Sanguina aurantia]